MDYHEFYRKHRNGEPLTVDDFADAVESVLDEMDRIIEELDRKKERRQMGAFDNNDRTITIPETLEQREKWGWDAHETVTLRAVPTTEDEEWVNNQVLRVMNATGKKAKKGNGIDLQSQLGATRRLWLERMIVRWTFTKGGMPMPVNSQSIKALSSAYADRIYQALQDEQPEDDEEESDDENPEGFTSGASATTEESDQAPEVTASRNYLSR